MSHTIYHDFEINASTEKVFKAISQPEHLINWWPFRCTGVPEEDAEYNFFFTSEYDWYGKVSKIENNKAFHIKMTKSDSDWDPTTFGFNLEEKEGKVLVKFSHSGWPECNAHFKHSSFCWAMLLNGLKNYVENGIIIPFEQRE